MTKPKLFIINLYKKSYKFYTGNVLYYDVQCTVSTIHNTVTGKTKRIIATTKNNEQELATGIIVRKSFTELR